MNRAQVCSLGAAIGAMLLGAGATAQSALNVTGNWKISASGEAFVNGVIALQQSGDSITGSYGQGGKIDGTFKAGTSQVDGNWGDARGNGWLTIAFSADGNGFSGDWGYAGHKPSGHFVGSRVVPVYPVVTGLYNISVSGGQELAARHFKLHQLGQNVVGNFGPGTQLSGTMAPDADTMTGTWQGQHGSGWIKLRFASDSRSFQGEWGVGSEAQPRGHISGSMVNMAQLWVKGLWQTASSSTDLSGGSLTLEQNGQTIVGTFKGGHLQGALPRGSSVMTGRWRGSRGTGTIVLTFASDGNSFQGTWTLGTAPGGRIVGKRNIASSPALR